MTFQAGQIIRPGKHTIANVPVITAKTITKGSFYRVVAGDAVLLATATSTEDGFFCAVETVTLTAQQVPTTVQMIARGPVVCATGGVIQPNGMVQIESGSAEVIAATAANFAAGLVIGRYEKVPGNEKAEASADLGLGIVDLGAA